MKQHSWTSAREVAEHSGGAEQSFAPPDFLHPLFVLLPTLELGIVLYNICGHCLLLGLSCSVTTGQLAWLVDLIITPSHNLYTRPIIVRAPQ